MMIRLRLSPTIFQRSNIRTHNSTSVQPPTRLSYQGYFSMLSQVCTLQPLLSSFLLRWIYVWSGKAELLDFRY